LGLLRNPLVTTRRGSVRTEEDASVLRNARKGSDGGIQRIVMTGVMIHIAEGNEKIPGKEKIQGSEKTPGNEKIQGNEKIPGSERTPGTKKEQALQRLHMNEGEKVLENVDTMTVDWKIHENEGVTMAHRRKSEAVTAMSVVESHRITGMRRPAKEGTQGMNE